MSGILFSCIIPCLDPKTDPYLPDLISSIKAQDFPQDRIEILVISEGDSEEAKAIGIRKAKGDIIGMFCADNMIMDKRLFKVVKGSFDEYPKWSAIYSRTYHHKKNDNSLNRYFSLIGGNDPICYYLGKNDRRPHVWQLQKKSNYQPSYGCNGTFYRSELIKATDLEHYYPMDNSLDVPGEFMPMMSGSIWHRTSDNLISFLKKRYRYARDLYCDRNDRRWKMLDTKEDYWNLFKFVFGTLTIIGPIRASLVGYSRIRDWAWFWHWPVCLGFLITYSILAFRNLFKHGRLFQCQQAPLLSRPSTVPSV